MSFRRSRPPYKRKNRGDLRDQRRDQRPNLIDPDCIWPYCPEPAANGSNLCLIHLYHRDDEDSDD